MVYLAGAVNGTMHTRLMISILTCLWEEDRPAGSLAAAPLVI